MWLGLDHGFGFGRNVRRRLTFETALFDPFNTSHIDDTSVYVSDCDILDRYSTEAEALEGHNRYKDLHNIRWNLKVCSVIVLAYALVYWLAI